MRINISNFGPVGYCEYNIDKNLICVFGENNIGKSYSMQVCYLLLKNLAKPNYGYYGYYGYRGRMPIDNEISEKCNVAIEEFKHSTSRKFNFTKKLRELINDYVRVTIGKSFFDSCKNTFESISRVVSDNPRISVDVGAAKIVFYPQTETVDCEFEIQPTYLTESKSYFHRSRSIKEGKAIYVVKNVDVNDNSEPQEAIIDTLLSTAMSNLNLFSKDYNEVYFFPASRSGIYNGLSAFGPIIAELSKNRAFLSKKIEMPGLTEPVADYYIELSKGGSNENKRYETVYGGIEKEILNGKILYDSKEKSLVYYGNDKQFSLKMSEVSSMVSEIAPIVSFLKYNVGWYNRSRIYSDKKSTPIIFIEEPEAHLHPKNQVKIMEAFKDLIDCGVHIILSSHSNYIFNKINNLILSKEIKYENYQPILMVQKGTKSEGTKMEISELGVTDDNFTDVSFELLNERNELIEKINVEE